MFNKYLTKWAVSLFIFASILVVSLTIYRKSLDFSEQIKSIRSNREADITYVQSKLGQPTEVIPSMEYNRRRHNLDITYNPAPPKNIDADMVMVYNKMPTIILVFVKDKRVVDVYEGKT